ncbi:MAG: hypothetical protein ABIQ44_03725, partial [Chloroflexia bacterium]
NLRKSLRVTGIGCSDTTAYCILRTAYRISAADHFALAQMLRSMQYAVETPALVGLLGLHPVRQDVVGAGISYCYKSTNGVLPPQCNTVTGM